MPYLLYIGSPHCASQLSERQQEVAWCLKFTQNKKPLNLRHVFMLFVINGPIGNSVSVRRLNCILMRFDLFCISKALLDSSLTHHAALSRVSRKPCCSMSSTYSFPLQQILRQGLKTYLLYVQPAHRREYSVSVWGMKQCIKLANLFQNDRRWNWIFKKIYWQFILNARIYFIKPANYSLSNSSFKKAGEQETTRTNSAACRHCCKVYFLKFAPPLHTGLASVPLHRCTPHPN